MKAANNDRLKFGLMWANHDWLDIHPATLGKQPALLYPGVIRPDTFETMTDYVIEKYFKHPSYWKVEGAPYFSVYELHTLIKSFGGVEQTGAALARFREKTKAAGFPDLHLNAITFGIRILPGETVVKKTGGVGGETGFRQHYLLCLDSPCGIAVLSDDAVSVGDGKG